MEDTAFSVANSLNIERDDCVGDREFRGLGRLGSAVLTDPKRGDLGSRQVTGEFMEEPAKLAIIGSESSQRLEAVDHQEGGTAFAE